MQSILLRNNILFIIAQDEKTKKQTERNEKPVYKQFYCSSHQHHLRPHMCGVCNVAAHGYRTAMRAWLAEEQAEMRARLIGVNRAPKHLSRALVRLSAPNDRKSSTQQIANGR